LRFKIYIIYENKLGNRNRNRFWFVYNLHFVFCFTVQSDSKYDNELVVEEYYKHDAHFGDEMARIQNAADLAQQLQVLQMELK
jgi:hypothetical protein